MSDSYVIFVFNNKITKKYKWYQPVLTSREVLDLTAGPLDDNSAKETCKTIVNVIFKQI